MSKEIDDNKLESVPDSGFGRRKRLRTSFLVRHILPSDKHSFIGRIHDLSIIVYHFDSYEELARHDDCKYAFHANNSLTVLTRRIESLNLVGDLLWPASLPVNFSDFPVSRYEWLTLAADMFLMRYISVVDCALLLVNEVYETGLDPKKGSIEMLERRGVSAKAIALLKEMRLDQGHLREERNARFHHGIERSFGQDDMIFRSASLIEHRRGDVAGSDRFGRKINMERFFKEGLVELQREFNRATRRLVRLLDQLYDELWREFEDRFGPRIRNSAHGLCVSRRQ